MEGFWKRVRIFRKRRENVFERKIREIREKGEVLVRIAKKKGRKIEKKGISSRT